MSQSFSSSPTSIAKAASDSASDVAYDDSLRFLFDRINYEKLSGPNSDFTFRLHRTAKLIEALGLQHFLFPSDAVDSTVPRERTKPRVPLVHIAGTKGKGSTAAMVASILHSAGLKTGLYTSPHLVHLEERFCVDGVPCTESQMTEVVQRMRPVVESLESTDVDQFSFFELTTAVALLHFHLQACDAVVLEVGLGGRLDSTNVCFPSVTAITSIGLDHQRVLGDTLAQIAAEKAGIIKPRVPVVSGVVASEPADVVAKIASERFAPLTILGQDFDVQHTPRPDWGSIVDFLAQDSNVQVELDLEGPHQAKNASIAIAIANLLRADGLPIDLHAIQTGLKQTKCAGRIQRLKLPNGTTMILDVAHNDDSVDALCETIWQRDGFEKANYQVVFATSRDKDAQSMLQRLRKLADRIVLTQYNSNPRFRTASELGKIATAAGWSEPQTTVISDPVEACAFANGRSSADGTVVVCGSFFLIAEVQPWALKLQDSSTQPSA